MSQASYTPAVSLHIEVCLCYDPQGEILHLSLVAIPGRLMISTLAGSAAVPLPLFGDSPHRSCPNQRLRGSDYPETTIPRCHHTCRPARLVAKPIIQ